MVSLYKDIRSFIALIHTPYTPTQCSRISEAKTEAMKLNRLFSNLLILLSSIAIARSDENECVYTVYIRTGSILKGGTDSIIGVTFYDSLAGRIEIPDLESWGGLMGPGYNYFERGNLDIFSGRGPCLKGPICAMDLKSDGSGPHHGWYCNYVEVTSTGPHIPCQQQLFTVEQWLALDTSPYNLTAVRDNCQYVLGNHVQPEMKLSALEM